MSHRALLAMTVLVVLGYTDTAHGGRRIGEALKIVSDAPGHPAGQPPTAIQAPHAYALVDTALLGEWTFDDGLGGPDPQGWTTHDLTEQDGTYFHVDDFAGLGGGSYGGLTPIRGTKSLWCGQRSACSHFTLPGYGDNWHQWFESAAFPTTGDVTVDFLIRHDVFAGEDFVHVEYFSETGAWRSVASFGGFEEFLATVTIPEDSLAGAARLRFRFSSSISISDEDNYYDSDGAVIIDSLTVRDAGGVVDFQDFESEAVDAQTTADGDWSAHAGAPYGNHAALFDGATVLQQDPVITNSTNLWGFFSGSTANYACGAHAEQLAVPYGKQIDGTTRYLDNVIRSPVIDVAGVTSDVVLEFDVYRGLTLNALVFYRFRVGSYVGGCWKWRNNNVGYYNANKSWFHQVNLIDGLIEPGATHIQIDIGVADLCPLFCGEYTGACHSHSPLIDNVRLTGEGTATGVTPTPGTPDRLALHQNVPNPFNPTTTIQYDVPAGGADVRIVIYDVAGHRVHTLVDEHRAPGRYQATWDGKTEHGVPAATGVYFYRMVAGSFVEARRMVLLK